VDILTQAADAVVEMADQKGQPVSEREEELQIRLVKLLGEEKAARLADLLEEVMQSPGWGDVKIVVVDGRPALLKIEKSYK
jgi:hypothetical protein